MYGAVLTLLTGIFSGTSAQANEPAREQVEQSQLEGLSQVRKDIPSKLSKLVQESDVIMFRGGENPAAQTQYLANILPDLGDGKITVAIDLDRYTQGKTRYSHKNDDGSFQFGDRLKLPITSLSVLAQRFYQQPSNRLLDNQIEFLEKYGSVEKAQVYKATWKLVERVLTRENIDLVFIDDFSAVQGGFRDDAMYKHLLEQVPSLEEDHKLIVLVARQKIPGEYSASNDRAVDPALEEMLAGTYGANIGTVGLDIVYNNPRTNQVSDYSLRLNTRK